MCLLLKFALFLKSFKFFHFETTALSVFSMTNVWAAFLRSSLSVAMMSTSSNHDCGVHYIYYVLPLNKLSNKGTPTMVESAPNPQPTLLLYLSLL